MRNPVSNGVTTVSHIDVINNAVEIKLPTYEQDFKSEENFFASKVQQSMRRSKVSGELERDMALSAPQPSARLPTATPLNPVTPLRWKSSKRLELEKKKLQDEINAKEVVKEEKKNSKTAKEERRDNLSKMTATPKPEVNVMEASHKADKDTTATSASTLESTAVTQIDGNTRDLKQPPSLTNGGNDEYATHSQENPSLNGKHGNGRSNGDVSGTDRKPLAGDESSVVTIDFLRARLLAERASSKAAKEHVQQLTKKVLELEGRLDQEILSRKKAEEAAQEALLKIESIEKAEQQVGKESSKILESTSTSLPQKLRGPNHVSETAISEPLSPHEKMKTEHQDPVKLSDQAEEICQVPVEVDDTKPNATMVTKPGDTLSISLNSKNGNEQVLTSEDKVTPSSDQENSDCHRIQNLEKVELQEVRNDTNRAVPRAVSTNCDPIFSTNSDLELQKRRLAVEERLRLMWDQITEEMATLAQDKTQEAVVREELLNWMGQVPTVLQDILPKPSEDKNSVTESSTKSVQLKNGDVPPESMDFDQALKYDTVEDLPFDGASSGEKSRVHDQGVKKVASLIERFEAQESNQREWEQSYAKQNSTGRRRSNEGSISRTNSDSGTSRLVESQDESQQQQSEDVAPKIVSKIEDPRHDSHDTNSVVSGISTESLLTRKENEEVDMQTPEVGIPSTCPDPPVVGEIVERSGEEGITYDGSQRPRELILKDAELESERSLVPSFITPRRHSTSSGPSAGENGDVRRSLVDRLQAVLKQGNHHLDQRVLEGTYEALAGHSGRSNLERGELPRSQTLAGWENLEDAQTYRVPTDKEDSALQWDASFIGLHLQQEKLASYSQAGNSNAYIRPEMPGTSPLRNDEREIYRGRMESVSRSMEGLGGSWRSLADPEGDDIQLYADIPESHESGTTRRPDLQMPFQVSGGSGRSNYYQAEGMVGTSQNLAYPSREFSRSNLQSRPSTKLESSTSKVNEVLKALQLAKLSIQKTGGRRTSISNTCYSTSEHSYSGGEKHNLKTDYGCYSGDGMTNRSPVAIRVWSHHELSRRYSTGSFRSEGGSPRLQHASSSVPYGAMIDARGKDPEEDHPLAGRSSPVSNAHRKLVDQISTGGVQYFYPN